MTISHMNRRVYEIHLGNITILQNLPFLKKKVL